MPRLPSPQGQANKWIRAMEASRKLVVLKPSTDPTYLRQLQASAGALTVCLTHRLPGAAHQTWVDWASLLSHPSNSISASP